MAKTSNGDSHSDEDFNALMRMNTELMSELWILKDRICILEKLLEEKNIIPNNAIDKYVPQKDFANHLENERDNYVRRVAGAPWETEFTLDTLIQRGQR
jgi:hypothetical protein